MLISGTSLAPLQPCEVTVVRELLLAHCLRWAISQVRVAGRGPTVITLPTAFGELKAIFKDDYLHPLG